MVLLKKTDNNIVRIKQTNLAIGIAIIYALQNINTNIKTDLKILIILYKDIRHLPTINTLVFYNKYSFISSIIGKKKAP